MATYDNRHWLLSHIRNSFISTDDTGMCETVMASEDLPKLLAASSPTNFDFDMSPVRRAATLFDTYPEMEQSDDDDVDQGSVDLHHDQGFGAHRQRSNTAQRLEKMEHAQRKAARIKIIKWEGPNNNLTDQELDQLFAKRDPKKRDKKRSLLSEQLEKCPLLPQTRYLEYAKYDGTAQFGLPTKSYKIFMTMLPEDHRNYPVNVCVIANAKIKDLIGFTCYKYSIAHPDIALASVSNYGLHVCEDDGEVDFAFACLDANEPCSKYGFTCLGLVDSRLGNNSYKSDIQTSSIPEKGGLNALTLPNVSGGAADGSKNNNDNLEKNGNASRINDLINKVNNVTFKNKTTVVVIDNLPSRNNAYGDSRSAPSSASADVTDIKWSKSSQDADVLNRMKLHELSIQAPIYQLFAVQAINKVRSNTPVQLGISGEKIEIDSLSSANLFRSKKKHVAYNIESILGCEILETKGNRSTFRIFYRSNLTSPETLSSSRYSFSISNRHLDFECDRSTAKEIVDKVSMILKVRPSSFMKELMTSVPKKSTARRSFI